MVDKSSAPAFSLGSPRQKITHSNEFTPGPGAYESVSYMQTSKMSQGSSGEKRFKEYGTFVPGPGTYGQDSKGKGPSAVIMSRSKEILNSGQLAPGPGSYQPNYQNVVKK